MPTDCASDTVANPRRTSPYRPSIGQRRWPSTSVTPLANRCTGSSRIWLSSTRPAMTRPPDAPMSTAAKTRTGLAEEGGGDAGVHGHEEPGGVAELVRAQGSDRLGDVFGEHLPLEQRALRVEGAELRFRDPVHGGPL